jgi:putative methyltransferase
LAVLLVHDLLLAKGGVATSKTNVLRVTIEKHKARLASEFTRCRIRNGFGSLEAFRAHVDGHTASSLNGNDAEASFKHPRWVRVNTIKTSTGDQTKTTLKDYREAGNLEEVLRASHKEKVFYVDEHIADLLAFPPNHDLSKTGAYQKGAIIFQDKASCFPAYLLDPSNLGGDIIDTCAAPGNKTTHLAALLGADAGTRKIFAFERNPHRTIILKKMTLKAGAEKIITVCGNTDFLTVKPDDAKFANVEALLLDPSCSGTGIVGRDDEVVMHLPEIKEPEMNAGSKKRKRGAKDKPKDKPKPIVVQLDEQEADGEMEVAEEGKTLAEWLVSLAEFQLQLVQHAMQFPRAKRITYSTCSIHAEENEHVVIRALASKVALERGWRLLQRDEQPEGLRKWEIRGDCDTGAADTTNDEIAEACIRTVKGTRDGTMGFFVAAFVRESSEVGGVERASGRELEPNTDEDEWGGVSDAD